MDQNDRLVSENIDHLQTLLPTVCSACQIVRNNSGSRTIERSQVNVWSFESTRNI